MEMPVLTIKEPFATAIVRGPKRVENRGWAPPEQFVGGWLLIHAGRSRSYLDDPAVMASVRGLWPGAPADFPHVGQIIGAVRLIGIDNPENRSQDGWASGPICWVLDDPRPFGQPFTVRGHPGVFRTTVPPWVPRRLEERTDARHHPQDGGGSSDR